MWHHTHPHAHAFDLRFLSLTGRSSLSTWSAPCVASIIHPSEWELSSYHTQTHSIKYISHLQRSGAFKLPCLAAFKKTKSQKKRQFDVPGVCGQKKRNYMTVNLSLIVGHIRNWKARFRGGMFVLEESRESVVSTGG
jgi:hypothetical protein